MKIGIEWNYDLVCSEDEQARYIKESGFDATFVARNDNIDLVMSALNRWGIVCENYHAPFFGINDIWTAGDGGDAAIARICACIDSCEKYGIPVVVIHLSSGMNPPRMSDIGFERIDRLMAYAERRGVRVAVENIRRLDNVAYLLENYPNAGFCWDVGHEACYMNGVEFMTLFGARISAIHLHDNTAVYDQDLHLLPYDGAIDMDRAAELFGKSPYSGSVNVSLNTNCVSTITTLSTPTAANAHLTK